MNEEQIRKIVREEMNKQKYQSGVSSVNPHRHDGVDNLRIPEKNIIPSVKANGTITMSQSATYTLSLGNIGGTPNSVTFYGGALNVGDGRHAMIVGSAQFGANQQFQPVDSTSVIIGPIIENIIQGSAAFIMTNGVSASSIIKNSQGHIIFAADASNNNYATATVVGYDNSSITIETRLASGWSISGLWIVN